MPMSGKNTPVHKYTRTHVDRKTGRQGDMREKGNDVTHISLSTAHHGDVIGVPVEMRCCDDTAHPKPAVDPLPNL